MIILPEYSKKINIIKIENSSLHFSCKENLNEKFSFIVNNRIHYQCDLECIPGIQYFISSPCIESEDCLLKIGDETISLHGEIEKEEKNYNDIVIVLSHADTNDKVEILEECIDELVNQNKKIIISTHIEIPEKLYDKVDYVVYDKDNPIILSEEFFEGFNTIKLTDIFEGYSHFFHLPFNHAFAVHKLILNACSIALSNRFENVHIINYDYVIKDKKLLQKNNVLLENYDIVSFDLNGHSFLHSQNISCAFFSSKLDKIIKKVSKFKTKEEFTKLNKPIYEEFLYEIFKDLRIHFSPMNDIALNNTINAKSIISENVIELGDSTILKIYLSKVKDEYFIFIMNGTPRNIKINEFEMLTNSGVNLYAITEEQLNDGISVEFLDLNIRRNFNTNSIPAIGELLNNQLIDYSLLSKKKIAICYWGPTRTTKQVYKSHSQFIFDVLKNKNYDFDVFMHTWKVDKNIFWDKEVDTSIDYTEHLYLNPDFYKLEDQNRFWEKVDFSEYFYQEVYDKLGHSLEGEWMPELVKNLICGLTSQKRVTKMCFESGENYDYIIYVRPDVEILKSFPSEILENLNSNEIAIPDFDHWEGYNDRFAVMKFDSCEKYSNRVDDLIDFRRNHGRIVSEKFLKFIIDKNYNKVHFLDFKFDIVRPKILTKNIVNHILLEEKIEEKKYTIEKYIDGSKPKRWDLINFLSNEYDFQNYLEIGVNDGDCIRRINIPNKDGVDPSPGSEVGGCYVPEINYEMTSDEFFNTHINKKYDIIFIDGLHHSEQVDKDIINSLMYLNDGGFIILHDCNPPEYELQLVPRQSGIWNGDVWKSVVKLRCTRNDLNIHVVDTDWGIGVIQKGNQEALKFDINTCLDWEFFDNNREEILNIISVDEFYSKFEKK